MSKKKARKNKPMNEMTNGLPPKTADELAIVYEVASAPTDPVIARESTPDEGVVVEVAASEVAPIEVAASADAPIEVAVSEDVPVEVAASEVAASEVAASEVAASADAPIEVEASEPTITAVEAPNAPSPYPIPSDGLRLRLKVWTDRATAKRYLMPSAFMRDVVRGQPVTDVMYAYAMCDDDTKLVTLTAAEWNALPFFYFKEDGVAPRATSRPVDVVDRGRPT